MSIDLRGWTPVAVRRSGERPVVQWCYSAGVEFDDPFFEQTVERFLRNPLRQLFLQETSLEMLVRTPEMVEAIPPSGFVFHMSRCGSTTVAQMFAATGSTLVVSEAEPLAAIAGSAAWLPSESDRVACLRGMMAALGQPRTPAQRHLVVKFDAWSVFDLPLIRQAFPDVPWIFLFREPAGVMTSQMRQRASYLVPGVLPETITGIPFERAAAIPQEEFCARVLARVCEAAMEHLDDHGLLLDYGHLPQAVPDEIAGWFGIPCPPEERRRMLDRARRDAKAPSLPFDPRPARSVHDDAVRRAADTHLAPVYARLREVSERAA